MFTTGSPPELAGAGDATLGDESAGVDDAAVAFAGAVPAFEGPGAGVAPGAGATAGGWDEPATWVSGGFLPSRATIPATPPPTRRKAPIPMPTSSPADDFFFDRAGGRSS